MNLKFVDVGLYYHYDKFPIFTSINFEVNDNKVGVYLTSQSGKTSLCRMLVDNVKYSGSILLNTVELTNIPHSQRSFGYISSSPIFFANKSVKYNLMHVLKAHKQLNEEIINKVLIDYSLNNYANCKVNKLDEINQTKLMLARLCLKERQLYVVDDYSQYSIESQLLIEEFLLYKPNQLIISSNIIQLKNCDIVYVIDNKQTIFSGSYDNAVKLIESLPKFE